MDFGGVINGVALGLMAMNDARFREVKLVITNRHRELELRGMRHILLNGRCSRAPYATVPADEGGATSHYGNNERVATFCTDLTAFRTRGCVVYKLTRKGGRPLPDGRLFVIIGWDVPLRGANQYFLELVKADFPTFPDDREELQRQYLHLALSNSKCGADEVLQRHLRLQDGISLVVAATMGTASVTDLRLELYEDHADDGARHRPVQLAPLNIMSNGHDSPSLAMPNAGPLAVTASAASTGTIGTASTGTMVVSSINGHRPSVSIAPPMLANDTTSNVVPSSVRLRRKIQIELRNQHSDILLCESQHDVAKGGCQQAPDAQIRPGNASSAEFRTAVYGAGRGWIVYQLTRAKDRVWQRRIFMAIAWDVPHTGVGRFHMTVFQADHKEFPQDHNERDRIFTLMWKEMMQRGHGQRVWTGELMPGIRFTLSTNVSGGSTARFMVNLTHEHEDRSMLTPIWLPAYTCFTYRTNFAAVQVQKLLAAAAGQQRNSLGYTGSFAMFVLVENAHPSTLLCLCSIDSRSRSVRKEGSAGVLRSGIHDILSAHVGESERSLMGHAVYQVAENLVLPSSSNLPTEGRASTSLGGGAGGEQRLYILVSWTAPTITQIRYGVEFFSAYDDEPLANSSATRSLFFVLAALSRGYRGHRVTRMASFKGESRALLVQGYLSMDDNPVLSVYFGPVSDTTAAVQRRTTFGGVAQGRMPTQVQFTLENLHPSVRLQSGRFYSVSSHILEDFDRALLPHGRAAGLIAADPSATASSGVVMYQIVDLEGKPLDNLPYLIIAWRMALENGNEEIRFVADVLQEVEFGERDPAGDAMLSLPNLYNVLMRSKDADASRGSYAVEDERVGFLSRRKNRSLYSVTLDSNVAKARNTLNAIICFSNESQGGRHASDNLSISSEETVAPSIAPDDDMDHPLSPPPVPALPSAHPNPIYWHPPRSTSLPAHKQLQPQPQPQPIVRPHTLATMVLDVHNLHAGIRLLYPHAYIVQGEPATIPSGTLGLGDQLSCEFTSTANGSGLAEGFIMAAVEDRERQLTTSTYLTIGWHVAPTGERAYFANAVQVTFDMHERFATHAGRDKFFRRLADTRMISAGGHVRQRIKVDGLNVALIGRLSRETEPGPPYLRMRLVDPNDPTLMRQRSGSLTSSGTNATSDSQSTVQPAVVEQYHSQFPPEDRAINFEPNPSMRARAPSSRVLPLSDTNSERSVPSMRNSVAIMPGVTTIEEYGSSSAREAAALKRQTLSGEVKYARMKSRPLPQPPSRDNSASNLSMLSTSMANASIGAPKPQETTGKADESSLAVNEASSNNGSSSSSGGSITAHRASQIMPIEAKEQLKLIFAIRNLLADISLQLVACQAVEGMCTRSLQEQVDARSRNEDWGTFASSTHLYDAATNEAIVQLEGIIAYRIGYTDGTPLARPVLLLIGWNMSQKAPNRLLLEIVALNSMQQLPNATDHRAWHDILQGLDAMSRFSCYGAVDMEIAIDDRRQIEIQASLTSGANAKLRIKLKELLLDERVDELQFPLPFSEIINDALPDPVYVMIENRHPYLLLKRVECATIVGDCTTQPAALISGNGGRASANFSFTAASASAPAACVGMLLYALAWPDGQVLANQPHLLVAWRAEGTNEEREFFARFIDRSTPGMDQFSLVPSARMGAATRATAAKEADRHGGDDGRGESLVQRLFQLINTAGMSAAGRMVMHRCTLGNLEAHSPSSASASSSSMAGQAGANNNNDNSSSSTSIAATGLELNVQGDMSREGAVNLVVAIGEEVLKRSATTVTAPRRDHRGGLI